MLILHVALYVCTLKNSEDYKLVHIVYVFSATYAMPIVPAPRFSFDEITPVDMKHVSRKAPQDKPPRTGELKMMTVVVKNILSKSSNRPLSFYQFSSKSYAIPQFCFIPR